MSRRKRGRTRGRSKKGEDEEEEKDPMPSIASLVTTPQLVGRVQCLVNIVNEVKSLWTNNEEDLPDDEIWPTSSMLDLYKAKVPCFELARLAAISVKNTLCAVLLSKVEELYEAEVKKIETATAAAKAAAKATDAASSPSTDITHATPNNTDTATLATNKAQHKSKQKGVDEEFTTELMSKVEDCNTVARFAIIGFIFDRCSSTDDDIRLESCDAMLKKKKMVRRFIQYCRDDTVTDVSKFGQRLLWRLLHVTKGRTVVAGYGGGEALITTFLAWLKRVRSAQKITEEHEKDFEFHCNEVANRTLEVNMMKEKNNAARVQAMRGLKQAKIDFEATKLSLEGTETRLKIAYTHHAESKMRLDAVAAIQGGLEKHMLK